MKSVGFLAVALAAVAANSSVEQCATTVTGILTSASSNKGAEACHKDTGISTTATSVTDDQIEKAAGSDACNKWWHGIVKEVKAVEPACEFPRFDGSGEMESTAKFHMKYKDFLKMTQKMAKGQAKPSVEQCAASVTGILTGESSSKGAEACHKDTGISKTATSITDEQIEKAAASEACNKWWHGIVKKVKAVEPACEFPRFDGSGAMESTAKFHVKYKDFLKMTQKMANAQGAAGAGANGTATTTKDHAALEKCGTTVAKVLTDATSNDGAKECSKETGISLTAASITDEELKKAANAKSCKKWWDTIVTDIKAIDPSCDFPSLDGSDKVLNTAKFDMKYKEFLEIGQKIAKGTNKAPHSTKASEPKKDNSASSAGAAATTTAAPATTAAPEKKSNAVLATLSVSTVAVVALFA